MSNELLIRRSSFSEHNAPSDIEYYQDAQEELEREGKWEKLIEFGKRAANEGALNKEVAAFNAEIANYYFYLGDYANALHHAKICKEYGINLMHPESQIRGLCIESACDLAEGNTQDALRKIESALVMVDAGYDFKLQGMVYLQAGQAIFAAKNLEHEKTSHYYQLALSCYSEGSDEWIRVKLHFADYYLQTNRYDQAVASIMNLEHNNVKPQTEILYAIIKAKMLKKNGRDQEASAYIRTILPKAQELNMKKEINLLEEML